ncbi:MAG: parallel beta-helix repeat protein [Myxococcota bacterium]
MAGAVRETPDGGVVQICPGTYPETLDLSGRDLTLVSTDGPEVTIIASSEPGAPILQVSDRADVVAIGLTFTGGSAAYGGAVLCTGSDLALTDSVVTDSSADRGGGLAALSCDITVSGTTLSGNTAAQYGGGMYLEDSSGSVEGSFVSNNTAYEGGGGFSWDGDVDFIDSTFTENLATTVAEDDWGPGGGGGGLWLYSDQSTVSGSTFSNNTSQYHAAGLYVYRGAPTIEDNIVSGNLCWEDGSGLYFNVSTADIIGNTIEDNEAYDDGGGLRLYYGSTVISGNYFAGNSAGDDGGGVKLSHSTHIFTGNELVGNVAGDAGGGVELDNDSSEVSDSIFTGNVATRGGGLHNWRTEQSFSIHDNEFVDNEAWDCGGGMSFDNSPHWITLAGLWMEGNVAVDGAAICVDQVFRDPEDVGGQKNYYEITYLWLTNSAITGSEASDDGAVYVKAGEVYLVNSVLDGNDGPGAAAVASKGSLVHLVNSIVTDNTDGPSLLVEDTDDGEGSISVRYSDLFDNDRGPSGMDDPVGANGNISADPAFGADYTLSGASPCIDAGDPSLDDADGSRSDMGLYGGPDGQ